MDHWQGWRHKNLSIVLFGIFVAFLLARAETFYTFLLSLGGFGYFGAFVAGIFFVSTFTVAIATVALFILTETLSPLEIGLIAGLGAVVGDFIIFRFVKDNLAEEIESIYNHLDHGRHFQKLFHSRYFSWTLPVIGALIIASPFPDELGVTLLGISKMKTYQFLVVSFILNATGIFLVVSASLII